MSYANLPLINYMESVPAASVEQFPYLQGQKAADILLDLLMQKHQGVTEQTAYYKIIIESQLIENRTVTDAKGKWKNGQTFAHDNKGAID